MGQRLQRVLFVTSGWQSSQVLHHGPFCVCGGGGGRGSQVLSDLSIEFAGCTFFN